jgi:hypothetical protein
MRRAIAASLACAASVAVSLVPAAGASPLGKALDYLSARQDPGTGAIGPAAGRAADTSWAAMAVAGARENPAAWGTAPATLADAVAALPVEATGDVLRLAVARRAAGRVDPDLANRVVAQQSADGAFPGGAMATAWGILALRAVGRAPDDPAVGAAVRALAASRLPDGGWAAAAGSPASDAVGTASAVQALRAARVPVADPLITAARARLLALRDPDGGFSRSAVPTAWAVLAIRSMGERPARGPWAVGGSPLAVLAALQDPDGGVRPTPGAKPSVFATAVAALAWSSGMLPVAQGASPTPARAPRVVRRTPASGDVVRGVLSVRYSDGRGGTGIDPRRTTIAVNGIDISRRARITPFTLQVRASALPVGALRVSVRVRDRAGHATVTEWTVTGTG